jgi:hypothetical protein
MNCAEWNRICLPRIAHQFLFNARPSQAFASRSAAVVNVQRAAQISWPQVAKGPAGGPIQFQPIFPIWPQRWHVQPLLCIRWMRQALPGQYVVSSCTSVVRMVPQVLGFLRSLRALALDALQYWMGDLATWPQTYLRAVREHILEINI